MNKLSIYDHLFASAVSDDISSFNKYIDDILDLEYKNDNGWTILIVAVFNHSYNIVSELLKRGANINATNNNGTTVFMYAKTKVIQNHNLQFLDYLIEQGANIYTTDIFDKTVLDYVEEQRIIFLVEYLKKRMNVG